MRHKLIEKFSLQGARRRTLSQSSYLFHRDDRVRFVFAIESGAVELVRPQPDGTPIILQRGGPETILAEASIYSARYHCDALATAPSVVLALPKPSFLSLLRTDPDYCELWQAHLAGEVQAARFRSEILARKTVAERLDIWLDWRGVELPAKGEWRGLAAQIGVSPEALYRELSKRRA